MSSEQEQFQPQLGGEGEVTETTDGEETFFTEEQEKKGASRNTLLLLGALGLVAGVAGVMHLRGGPQEAAATPGDTAASQAVSQFLDGGGQNIEQMRQMLQDTERVVEQFLAYPSVTQVPLDELQGNPFRFRAAEQNGGQELDEEQQRREQERQAALKAVQALHLQSIMHSEARRACMINNVVYQEGQQVNGFTIRSIEPSSVIVQRDRYRFELRMRQ